MAANPTDIEPNTFDAGHDSMRQGWDGTLDQFAAYLAKLPAVAWTHSPPNRRAPADFFIVPSSRRTSCN